MKTLFVIVRENFDMKFSEKTLLDNICKILNCDNYYCVYEQSIQEIVSEMALYGQISDFLLIDLQGRHIDLAIDRFKSQLYSEYFGYEYLFNQYEKKLNFYTLRRIGKIYLLQKY